MKLWHDDVRPAPEGWTWVRNNRDAMFYLDSDEKIEAISLDHDLGATPSDGIYAKGNAQETGLDLVRWMIGHYCVPPVVRIHSWNGYGAAVMASELRRVGFYPIVEPFKEDEISPAWRAYMLEEAQRAEREQEE